MVSALLVASLAAAAASAPPAPPAMTPRWVTRPTGDDVAVVFPKRAQAEHVNGGAVLHCLVAPDGRLDQCRVFAEAPPGMGFGLAALRLAPAFRMTTPDARPGAAAPHVSIPIRFTIDGGSVPKTLIVNEPHWASAPTFEDVAKAFPRPPSAGTADVTLRCHVDSASGAVDACAKIEERPSGQGFAAAALSLATRFRLEPDTWSGGLKQDLAADIRIHFSDPNGAGATPRQITKPVWIDLPSAADAAAAFPAAATAKGLTKGRGVASCVVAPDGRLKNCVPLTADPEGLGFSEAAVKIASAMRMNPWTDAGEPVDGASVRLPIRFDLPANKP